MLKLWHFNLFGTLGVVDFREPFGDSALGTREEIIKHDFVSN